MKRSLFVMLSLSLSLSACAKDMDPPSRVEELRLLAVEADQPFALPGDEVQLRALAFDPAQRVLSWGWGVCIDAASSLAVDCLRTLSFENLTIGTDLTEHTVLVPPTTAPSVGVAVVLCPGTLSPGSTATMPLRCLDQSGRALDISELELGLKRIYTRDPALNQNPEIAGVLWDGQPWAEGEIKQDSCKQPGAGVCSEGVEHTLAAQAPRAAQTSTDPKGLAIEEVAVVQYYATAGKFEDEVRFYDAPETKWHARKQDAGKLVTFWFVVRDDRGGVSWTSRQVQEP